MITLIFGTFLIGQIPVSDWSAALYVTHKLQPGLSEQEVEEFVSSLLAQSNDVGMSWTKMMALFFQESSFQLDPKNCMQGAKTCTGDFGVGQVNFKIWGNSLNMNRYRMLTDYSYSMRKSSEVLKYYYEKYGFKNPENWWSFYHSKTPKLRKLYQEKVLAIHAKIRKELEVNEDGRICPAYSGIFGQRKASSIHSHEELFSNFRFYP